MQEFSGNQPSAGLLISEVIMGGGIKSGRGGQRSGAGRKPRDAKQLEKKLPADTAALILSTIKANQKWVKLAGSEDPWIVLHTLKYLTDRAYGKAPQAVEHTGAISFRLERIGG